MRCLFLLAAVLFGAAPATADVVSSGGGFSQGVVRIGVLNDADGVYADIAGSGSVEAARMAVEDFGGSVAETPVEVVHGDHGNDAARAAGIARDWVTDQGIDVIADVPNTDAMLAVQEVARDTRTIFLAVGAADTAVTGRKCSPYGFHWAYDTYSLAKGTADAMVQAGGVRWFNVVVDYGFGHALEAETRAVVEAAGGHVVGTAHHPLDTPDLSDPLLQALDSAAHVVGLVNAGGDMVRAVQQAVEFGLPQRGQTLAAMLAFIQNIHALGLDTAQGLMFTTAFYWDRTDDSRAWSRRFFDRTGQMPSMIHAGVYSAVLHTLKAMETAGTDDGDAVAAAMRRTPVTDMFAENARIRVDGRLIHDMYLVQVKKPHESTGPWDLYRIVGTLPGETAARPLEDGGCPLVR